MLSLIHRRRLHDTLVQGQETSLVDQLKHMTSKRRQKDRSFRHQNYYCWVKSCLHCLILLFVKLRVRFSAYEDGQILHLVIYCSRGIVDKICHVNQVFNSAFLVVIIWRLDDVLDVISNVWETFFLI